MKFLWLIGSLLLLPTRALGSEDTLYDFVWLDPDKEVFIIQNKPFTKEHHFHFDLGYLSNNTSKFQDTSGLQGRVTFYVHEEWGIELFTNYYTNKDNDDLRNILAVNDQQPFIRRLTSSYGLNVLWSPFYGKINTFNKIYYFDWAFGAGLAQVNTQDNLKTSIESIQSGTGVPNKFVAESYIGGVLKTNVKFYILDRVHIGAEYMNTYYRAPSPKSPKTDKLRTNTDIILSVGFSL